MLFISRIILICLFVFSFIPTPFSQASVFSSLPIQLTGLKINPQNPFQLDFLINISSQQKLTQVDQERIQQLIRYFLTGVTMKDEDLWVNLSPLEADRIIPEQFAQTEMGQALLEQDYQLKKMITEVLSPEHPVGNRFWNEVEDVYPNQEINLFHKIWIVPKQAKVFVINNNLLIQSSILTLEIAVDKMLQDAYQEQSIDPKVTPLVEQIILPELERIINTSERFQEVRTIYQALILAQWYQQVIANSLLKEMYSDQNKVTGIDMDDVGQVDKIYRQYLMQFDGNGFQITREEFNPYQQEFEMKSYHTGGVVINGNNIRDVDQQSSANVANDDPNKNQYQIGVELEIVEEPLEFTKENVLAFIAETNPSRQQEIADYFGKRQGNVSRAMKRWGISLKPKPVVKEDDRFNRAAVELYISENEDAALSDIAGHFGVSKGRVQRLIDLYNLDYKKKKPTKSMKRLSAADLKKRDLIQILIDFFPELTIEQLGKRFGYSRKKMTGVMKRLGIEYEKKTPQGRLVSKRLTKEQLQDYIDRNPEALQRQIGEHFGYVQSAISSFIRQYQVRYQPKVIKRNINFAYEGEENKVTTLLSDDVLSWEQIKLSLFQEFDPFLQEFVARYKIRFYDDFYQTIVLAFLEYSENFYHGKLDEDVDFKDGLSAHLNDVMRQLRRKVSEDLYGSVSFEEIEADKPFVLFNHSTAYDPNPNVDMLMLADQNSISGDDEVGGIRFTEINLDQSGEEIKFSYKQLQSLGERFKGLRPNISSIQTVVNVQNFLSN